MKENIRGLRRMKLRILRKKDRITINSKSNRFSRKGIIKREMDFKYLRKEVNRTEVLRN